MENEKKRNESPYNYVYEPDTKVEVEGVLLSHLIAFANKLIDDNTQTYFTDKFKYINKETDKAVSKAKQKDIDEGKVTKIVDIEKTLQAEPKHYRNETALQAIDINLKLNSIHMKAVKEGKAVHFEDLQTKEEQKPQLETV